MRRNLGGEDFHQRIVEYFIELCKNKTGKDIRKDYRAVQKLRHEVKKVKRTLSSQHQVKIEIESFLQKALKPFNISTIDEIILVGGSTRIPKVLQLSQVDQLGSYTAVWDEPHVKVKSLHTVDTS
ncbi:unnamed protein product [Rotaria socialis]|uniref:Heat shock protein 70 n=1 Tax=Rotaria socialis TaxID=392032 RepID=A0A818EN72_9BILA|nr:unnamed protein product [Rotaria socialis]